MQLATWNVNSLAVRLPQVLEWLAAQSESAPVDALALQETKLTDDKFPHAEFAAAGYHAVWFGQKTYNGVALLTRSPVLDVQFNIPGLDDAQARVVAATVNGVRVIGAYVPNGQSIESDKFVYKLGWLQALNGYIQAELQRYPRLVLMGDFNIAPQDRDVHDPVAWAGQVLCTPEERAQMQSLLDLGLVDAYRLFDQPPRLWSWWDYRNLAFRKNQGLRIDLILVSQALQGAVTACSIDKQPRKNERPSDHAPVWVTLA